MLSDLEKDRLVNRNRSGLTQKDIKDRATNDMRVRRKLSSWLKDISDAVLVLQCLPDDQLDDIIDDWHIYFLLNIAEAGMDIKRFHPIEGDAETPEKWQTVLKYNDQTGKAEETRAAEKLDIARSGMLSHHIGIIGKKYLGYRNPVTKVAELSNLYQKPKLKDKVSEGERRAVEIYIKAFEDFLEQTVKIEIERGTK